MCTTTERVLVETREIEGYRVELYELYITREQRVNEDPIKYINRVIDLKDVRHDHEFMFDHIFPARAQRKRCVDFVKGLIKRKVRQKMGKRRYRMKELSHRKGATTTQERNMTREQIVEAIMRRRMNGVYHD